ncbi:MAG: glycoside hydrolase family 28 protein [Acetobacteraceae bacterium]|nr:glycoside hydrolase family 28 protein [Acetobacteraceae bacterium]
MSMSDGGRLRRRTLLAGVAGAALASPMKRVLAEAAPAGSPWLLADGIRALMNERLLAPIAALVAGRRFDVTAFGARTCDLAATQLYITPTKLGPGLSPAPGSFDNYGAFAAAIAACHAQGGGQVYVPAGNWYCAGPVTLLSNVNFHLASGAQIWFSPNPADYAKYGPVAAGANGNLVQSRWQGNDCYNFSPMVYAYGQSNIALTGEDHTSILNGQAGTPYDGATCWWTWKGTAGNYGFVAGAPSEVTPNPLNLPLSAIDPTLPSDLVDLIQFGNPQGGTGTAFTRDSSYLPALSEAGIPLSQRVFGLGHQLPPSMIEFVKCTGVLMANYQSTNTPFWQHHPVACKYLAIIGVYANSVGPNNDGFDPEACNWVLADGVTFNTGDDCIAIKSGKDTDIEFGPAQNHLIANCVMNSGHGGITIGSEMSGGAKNIFAENLQMLNQNYGTNPLNIAIRVKTNLNRGGTIESFYVRDVTLPNGINLTPSFYTPLPGSPIPPGTVSTNQGGIITFDCDYSPGSDNVRIRPPVVTDVVIENVTASAPPGAASSCYQAIIMQGPVASDYNGLTQPPPSVVPVTNVTIRNCDFGQPVDTAEPVYLYNVRDLLLDNVTIGGVVYNADLSA